MENEVLDQIADFARQELARLPVEDEPERVAQEEDPPPRITDVTFRYTLRRLRLLQFFLLFLLGATVHCTVAYILYEPHQALEWITVGAFWVVFNVPAFMLVWWYGLCHIQVPVGIIRASDRILDAATRTGVDVELLAYMAENFGLTDGSQTTLINAKHAAIQWAREHRDNWSALTRIDQVAGAVALVTEGMFFDNVLFGLWDGTGDAYASMFSRQRWRKKGISPGGYRLPTF